jgi:hypothetical protein
MYVVRRVFVSIKVSVLRIVLGNSVTATMIVLWEWNVVVMENVLTHSHGSVSNNVNRTLNVIRGSIVARRKVYGFGKIVVLRLALVRFVSQMMTVDLLMNAVLLENVQIKVVRSVLVTRTVLQVFTVARRDSQTRPESAWRTALENHVEPLLTAVIKMRFVTRTIYAHCERPNKTTRILLHHGTLLL